MTKTRLMQNLTLSYDRVQNYCDVLLQEGLIQRNEHDHTVSITSKGHAVLNLSEELATFLTPVDEMIKRYSAHIENRMTNETSNVFERFNLK